MGSVGISLPISALLHEGGLGLSPWFTAMQSPRRATGRVARSEVILAAG